MIHETQKIKHHDTDYLSSKKYVGFLYRSPYHSCLAYTR